MAGSGGGAKPIWNFDPRSVPGCALWLDAADRATLTLSGSNVTHWRDKSGNGYNASPYGTGSAVTYVAGSKSLYFPGFSGFSTTLLNATNRIQSGFFVATVTTANGGVLQGSGLANGGRQFRTQSPPVTTLSEGVAALLSAGSSLTTQALFAYTDNGSTITHSVNGVTSTGTSSTQFPSGTTVTIGRTHNTEYMIGNINEVVIYNAALTSVQRQQVEGYLAWKWGFTPPPMYTTFTFTGSLQSYVVPAGATTSYVYMWGAGGGGGGDPGGGSGGAGAYIQGALSTTPGETLSILVGGGGKFGGNGSTNPQPAQGGFGGGGNANTGGGGNGSAGGGRSAIRRSGTDIVTVGGGGGGAYGQGGPATWQGTAKPGGYNWPNNDGGGGTQTAGGAAGINGNIGAFGTPTSGSQFQGGNGNSYGGGGGGGWYGGGGGSTTGGYGASGGGGSSYTSNLTGASGADASTGTYSTAPAQNLSFYVSGVAAGSNADVGGGGGPGLVVISSKPLTGGVAKITLPIAHPFRSIRPFLRAFQPTDIDGCMLWLDGSDRSTFTFSSGSNIASIKDKAYGTVATTFSNSVASAVHSGGTIVNGTRGNGSIGLLAGNGLQIESVSMTPTMTVFYVSYASGATSVPTIEWSADSTANPGFLLSTRAGSNFILNAGITYSNFLMTTFFANTGSIPDRSGPTLIGGNNSGWGSVVQAGQALNPINFGNNLGYQPAGNYNYSALTTGFVYSASVGTIQFQGTTDDGLVVRFNGVDVLNQYQQQGATTYYSGSLVLPAGYTPIRIIWYDTGGGGQYQISFSINGGAYTNNGTGVFYRLSTATY